MRKSQRWGDFVTDFDDGLLEIDNYVVTFDQAWEGLARANVARLEMDLGITPSMARDMAQDAAQRKILKGILLSAVVETDEDLAQFHGKESAILDVLGQEGQDILARAVESETAENVQLASHVGQMETLAGLERLQHDPEVPLRPQSLKVDMTVASADDAIDAGAGTVITYARRVARDRGNVHFGTITDALRGLK